MVSSAAKTQRYTRGGMSLGPCHGEVPGVLSLGSFSDVTEVGGPRGLEVQGWGRARAGVAFAADS